MTEAERLEALIDLADPDRTSEPSRNEKLVVLGLAERTARSGYRPTTAGWSMLGAQGRPFRS